MRNKRVLFKVFIAAITATVFFACRHSLDDVIGGGSGNGGGTTPPAVTNCSPDSVYFVNEIMPLISSNCTMSGCHDNVTHADGVNLTTYAKIMQYVVAGNATNSKLYKVIIKTNGDRMPPPPMPAFTTEQKAKIQKWINQGAKNNSCTGSCDTAIFTYSGAVKNIMGNKCVGCHNPSNLGGNIDLSTYNAVKVSALNGKLYGSIAHQPGYSAMPKNATKLSDCEIRQVQKWIDAGSLNN
ncbi:MAG: c-type cytochrome [Chitinophagaceae bacterium]|nr:c-type cytochrome [Chitinophagaceae bacterium]